MPDLRPIPPDLPPLYTQNPQSRFADRATDYAKYRPSYPAEAITAILAGLDDPARLTAADIGAGTGISSWLLAGRGLKVWAIEPNDAMRTAAIADGQAQMNAQTSTQIEFRAGTAEQTGLSDRAVDLITCFQAFHWFEPDATLREFHRILKPAGRVALIWNDRDREDEFTNQYTEVIRQAADPHYFERLDRKASDTEALRLSPLFTNYSAQTFTNSHRLDQAGLVGIALSASYIPKSGELHDQLLRNLQQLYDQWQGAILSYRTHLFLANAIEGERHEAAM
jgi:ubiquinone/menaquinone biosynthesis C-methylase UbiE